MLLDEQPVVKSAELRQLGRQPRRPRFRPRHSTADPAPAFPPPDRAL